MRLLLDTNALLWWGQAASRLPDRIRKHIAEPATETLFSIVSLWELVMKARSRDVTFDVLDVERRARAAGMVKVGIEVADLDAVMRLPLHHRDPFDHVIIAQAIRERAIVITSDRMFAHYDIEVLAI